ncbi:MAG: hypothetical protein KKH61_19960 [Gammaproteobacteria bacterium]|nr:hypothetical protein [Gammaproteobacteria bacterium]
MTSSLALATAHLRRAALHICSRTFNFLERNAPRPEITRRARFFANACASIGVAAILIAVIGLLPHNAQAATTAAQQTETRLCYLTQNRSVQPDCSSYSAFFQAVDADCKRASGDGAAEANPATWGGVYRFADSTVEDYIVNCRKPNGNTPAAPAPAAATARAMTPDRC